jgi:hypothetical protein
VEGIECHDVDVTVATDRLKPLLNRTKLSEEKTCPTAGKCDSIAVEKAEILTRNYCGSTEAEKL